ncbi:MAG: DNA polymerase I, partial [Anaerolineae bacterium]|nr:DNA polymerase I [Anaerolineae bacterium]
DSSDNIPGVSGIGEKGATSLIQEYGSLNGIYAHLDDVSTRYRKKLEAGREMAYLSYDLARIRHDVPVQLDLAACVAHDFDREQVVEIFRRLEFRSLVSRLPGGEAVAAAPTVPTTPQQLSMFAEDAPPAPVGAADVPEVVHTVIVQEQTVLDELVRLLNTADGITFDVETTSTNQMQAKLVGIALTVRPEAGYYIPVGHVPPAGADQGALLDEAAITQLPLETVIEALRAPLTNPAIPKYAHNASYDLVVMRRYGIDVTPIGFDTMLAEWLRDPASRNKGLKNLALAKLGVEMTPIDALIGSGRNQTTMDYVSIERAAPYAAADAAITHRLVGLLQQDLDRREVSTLYHDLELPLIPILADMEMAGVLLDVGFLHEMSGELTARLAEIEQETYALSGGYGEFNLNSPKQLNDVLFGKLQLPTAGIKKTTHGFSTAADVLEELEHAHPIVPLILEYRELSKLKGTYVDALPELVNPETGRLHTSFNQTGTVTGRISSDNPNLQNIPVRTEQGRQIRKAFVAPADHVLLAVDYSQVELRVLAHISGDEKLLAAFREGQDIHRTTAAAIYNVPFADVTYEQRRFAKSINFGLLYGMGAFRLARDSDLTLAQAETFIETYFRQFPSIRAYLEGTKQRAAAQGYLETLLGRRRYFPELSQADDRRISAVARQRAERQAINMPIQGTAADIMKLAMIHVHQRLHDEKAPARMLLQVHDELVLEVQQDALDAVTNLVRDTMESAFTLKAPLRADAQYGQNWLDMTEYTR